MSRTDQNTKGRPACLTLLVPIRITGQQTGPEGMILPDFSGLPSWVDSYHWWFHPKFP